MIISKYFIGKYSELAEAEVFLVLKGIKGYPFDQDKDLDFIRQLRKDFPTLDLYEEIKQWNAWMLDNRDRLKKRVNYRSRLRTWCKNASKWKADKSAGDQSRKRYRFEQPECQGVDRQGADQQEADRHDSNHQGADPQGGKITDVW
ncbi:MAG: hypothetical protein AB1847_19715 [bacterium]